MGNSDSDQITAQIAKLDVSESNQTTQQVSKQARSPQQVIPLNDLPYDIVELIWEATMEPRTIRLQHKVPIRSRTRRMRACVCNEPHLNALCYCRNLKNAVPVGFQVCHESREVFKKRYQQPFSAIPSLSHVWVNYDVDIFVLLTPRFLEDMYTREIGKVMFNFEKPNHLVSDFVSLIDRFPALVEIHVIAPEELREKALRQLLPLARRGKRTDVLFSERILDPDAPSEYGTGILRRED